MRLTCHRQFFVLAENEYQALGVQHGDTCVPSLLSHGTFFSETPMPGRPRAPPTRAHSP